MPDFLPRNDSVLVNWLNAFMTVLAANLAALGLVAGDIAPLSAAVTAFSVAVTDQVAKKNAFNAAVAATQMAKGALMIILRPLIRQITNHPGMTDDLRSNLGLPVPDRTRTRHAAGTDIPGIALELLPGRVVIHFGTNPDNELRNGKPSWALGVNIYRQIAGEAGFTLIAMDTASPYTDNLPAGTVVSYKLAYRGTRETDIGPESLVQTATVGG